MALSKKTRFEVFKRDSFTCHYCGRKAPDVVLQVDHIQPRSKKGKDDLLNLITSCFDCNMGKKDRELSDDSVVAKQRGQLEALQERKEQIEMMLEWQRSLMNLDQQAIDGLSDFWCSLADWTGVTEIGRAKLRKWLRKYDVGMLADAMRKAAGSYFKFDENSHPTVESTEHAFNKIGSIIWVGEAEKENPDLKEVFYIRGIIRNRFEYCNLWQAKDLLEAAFSLGGTSSELRSIAFECGSWTAWRNHMYDYIDGLKAAAEEPD